MPQLASGEREIVTASETAAEKSRAAHHETRRAEIRAARQAGQNWRRISRYLGLAIFVFGALLLAYVFKQALDGFNQFSQAGNLQGEFNRIAGDSWEDRFQAVAAVFGAQLLKVLYLLILGFLASAIAARGIQFFAASEAVIDEAVIPDEG